MRKKKPNCSAAESLIRMLIATPSGELELKGLERVCGVTHQAISLAAKTLCEYGLADRLHASKQGRPIVLKAKPELHKLVSGEGIAFELNKLKRRNSPRALLRQQRIVPTETVLVFRGAYDKEKAELLKSAATMLGFKIEDKNSFGEQFLSWCQSAGMSVDDVIRKTGICRPTVISLFNRPRKRISYRVAETLQSKLGLPKEILEPFRA